MDLQELHGQYSAMVVDDKALKLFLSQESFYQNPILAHDLLNEITNTTIQYLKGQIHNGVDIVQIFDSWAGILPKNQYVNFPCHI